MIRNGAARVLENLLLRYLIVAAAIFLILASSSRCFCVRFLAALLLAFFNHDIVFKLVNFFLLFHAHAEIRHILLNLL